MDYLRVGVMSYSCLIFSRLCTCQIICYLIATCYLIERDYMYHTNRKPQQGKNNWHHIFKSSIYILKFANYSIWTTFFFFFFTQFLVLSFFYHDFLPSQPRCWLFQWLDQRWPFCVKTEVKKILIKSLCLLYVIS